MSETFLCFTLHQIPDLSLLSEHVSLRKFSSYTAQWLSPKAKPMKVKKDFSVPQGTPLLAVLNGQLNFLPLDKFLLGTEMPYALGYDFAFTKSTEIYSPIARWYGFTIATLPLHDWTRAQSAFSTSPASALLYADRAILTLSEQKDITDAIDKAYVKFAKLRNLFINQPTMPEGILAAHRAMQMAQKCLDYFKLEGN